MTDLELVKDTVNYYAEDLGRRAIANDSMCEYRTEEGKQCAIGRLIDENKLIKNGITWRILNKEGSLDGGLDLYLEEKGLSIENILKDEYMDITYDCLCDLQGFHDYELTRTDFKNRGKTLIRKYEA